MSIFRGSLASDVSRILKLVSSEPALPTIAKSDDARLVLDTGHVAKSAVAKRHPQFSEAPATAFQDPSGVELRLSAWYRSRFFDIRPLLPLFWYDFDDSECPLKGRHMVDEHRYGECNLHLMYQSEETFAQHIRAFHQCSFGHFWHISNKSITAHYQFGQEKGFQSKMERMLSSSVCRLDGDPAKSLPKTLD